LTDSESTVPYPRKASDYADLARELAMQPNLRATLHAIVSYAAKTIDGAEQASITLRRASNCTTPAATGELPMQVDAIQYRALEGPCLDALTEHHVIRSDDLGADQRWPVFGRLAADTGVMSMVSHRLFLKVGDPVASLNLYSTKPGAFGDLDLSELADLATHCAIALSSATAQDDNEHLRLALDTSRDIGAALGILMATTLVTKDQAFDLLRIASQTTHRKLRDVALDVIETGQLPGFTPKLKTPSPVDSVRCAPVQGQGLDSSGCNALA
jgi:GAF domain-containing protein